MNIGFYGPSVVLWRPSDEFSFITRIRNHFNGELVHTGTPLCSEERLLYEIKKTKKLDLAIVVHTKPKFIFVPSWNRDIRTTDKEDILKKFQYNLLDADGVLQDPDSVRGDINENYFENKDEFILAVQLYYKYMMHPDLQRDRYHGALIQIDQYLTYKKIPTVHIVGVNTEIPKWFEFKSGVTFQSMPELLDEHAVHRSQSANMLDAEGNDKIFKKILPVIQKAIDKVSSGE